jgi:hypothetical protein
MLAGLSARLQELLDAIALILGSEAATAMFALGAGVTFYWVYLAIRYGIAPAAVGYVGKDIDAKTKQGFKEKKFKGFTVKAWKIGVVCATVIYAVIWVGKHFPTLWLVWFALLLGVLVVLSVIGYWKSGPRMTPLRFLQFYGPTGTVILQQLPDVIEKAIPMVMASL